MAVRWMYSYIIPHSSSVPGWQQSELRQEITFERNICGITHICLDNGRKTSPRPQPSELYTNTVTHAVCLMSGSRSYAPNIELPSGKYFHDSVKKSTLSAKWLMPQQIATITAEPLLLAQVNIAWQKRFSLCYMLTSHYPHRFLIVNYKLTDLIL